MAEGGRAVATVSSALDRSENLGAEICIVGTGPVAQSTARSLAGSGVDVLMIEAGGVETDRAGRRLASTVTPSVGRRYPNAAQQFSIRMGGTSAAWGISLDPARSDVPGNGLRLGRLGRYELDRSDGAGGPRWPFGLDEITPFYEQAEATFGIPAGGGRQRPIDDGRFEVEAMWVAEATPFLSPVYDDVRIVTHCVAERLHVGSTGRVTRLTAVSRSGIRLDVGADVFVLALGAIQTVRLLLNSPWNGADAVADSSGLVGRNLVDHPQLILGQLVPDRCSDLGAMAELATGDSRADAGGGVVFRWPNLVTSPERADEIGAARLAASVLPDQRRRPTLSRLTNRVPRPLGARTRALDAAERLIDAVRHRRFDPRLLGQVPAVVEGLDEVILPMVRRRRTPSWSVERPQWSPDQAPSSIGSFQLLAVPEQLPDPENRIVLTGQRDALGIPRVRIHWRWSTEDARRTERSADDVREFIADLGIGRFLPRRGRASIHKANAHHPSGTTVMSTDPNHGVVDPDLRAHDHPNLFIVGSGVFPRSGYSNPTLTAVALGFRLGRHLLGHGRPQG